MLLCEAVVASLPFIAIYTCLVPFSLELIPCGFCGFQACFVFVVTLKSSRRRTALSWCRMTLLVLPERQPRVFIVANQFSLVQLVAHLPQQVPCALMRNSIQGARLLRLLRERDWPSVVAYHGNPLTSTGVVISRVASSLTGLGSATTRPAGCSISTSSSTTENPRLS